MIQYLILLYKDSKNQLLHQNWIVYRLLCIVYSKIIQSLIYTIFLLEAKARIHLNTHTRGAYSNRRITDRSRVQHARKISSKRGQTQALTCLSSGHVDFWSPGNRWKLLPTATGYITRICAQNEISRLDRMFFQFTKRIYSIFIIEKKNTLQATGNAAETLFIAVSLLWKWFN
jgi:hypothetical protein